MISGENPLKTDKKENFLIKAYVINNLIFLSSLVSHDNHAIIQLFCIKLIQFEILIIQNLHKKCTSFDTEFNKIAPLLG